MLQPPLGNAVWSRKVRLSLDRIAGIRNDSILRQLRDGLVHSVLVTPTNTRSLEYVARWPSPLFPH